MLVQVKRGGSLRRCRQVAEGGAAEDRKDSCEHAFHVRIGNDVVAVGSVLRKTAAQAVASASSSCRRGSRGGGGGGGGERRSC